MPDQFFTGQKDNYTLAKELGKGGEGSVYELRDHPALVVKLYTELPDNNKAHKLQLMASMGNQQLLTYTAWPQDVVKDARGNVSGFVMKKLANYVPLHMLFSPMDRKKLFPDKGYNFLVHVARNMAMAFHACHEAGIVIGDVNEGNILVNNQGMVAFIDCDSFQLKDGNGYHFCEVGVPRYTPPELLEQQTFANVVRTINTDCFSMAVLIFQLLFLGRHPFAGKNLSKEDIDEETAIKRQLFAFSLRNKANKLAPPNDSYAIGNLTGGLSNLFHQAFESKENRPVTTAWVQELKVYLDGLVVCTKSKIHTYPSGMAECPWCNFKENRNILYFLDDNYLQQIPSFQNIEQFINGFKIEKLHFQRMELPTSPSQAITPSIIDNKYSKFLFYYRLALGILLAISLFLYVVGGWTLTLALVIIIIAARNQIPWKHRIDTELKKRKKANEEIKKKLEAATKEFNTPSGAKNYNDSAKKMETLILEFKGLPNELQARRKALEEKLYTEQLHHFLFHFDIRNYAIPSFGPARKLTLHTAGIRNAADISKLHNTKVQGIGPAFEQVLFSWQRQMASQFVYHPDNDLISREHRLIVTGIEQAKQQLENDIKREYQALHYLKMNIRNRQEQLKKHIEQGIHAWFQAEADYKAFKKIIY